MIFSFSEEKSNIVIPEKLSIDVLCFFTVDPHHVKCPADAWFEVLRACLKNKKHVLLLESHVSSWPEYDEKNRWQVGDGWMWQSPRALSVISAISPNLRTDIRQFQSVLSLL